MGHTVVRFDQAVGELFTVEQAVEALKKNARVRTFAEAIAPYIGIPADHEDDIRQFLVRRLIDADPDVDAESHQTVVNNWLGGIAPNLKSAYKLCFALGLSPVRDDEKISRLLVRVGSQLNHFGEPPHWRRPEQLVYLYALNRGLSWKQAQEVMARMKTERLLENAPRLPAYHFSPAQDRRRREEPLYTRIVKEEVLELETEEQLKSYLQQHQHQLGQFHNSAYQMFRDMIDSLFAIEEKEEALEGKYLRGMTDEELKEEKERQEKGLREGVQKTLRRNPNSNAPDLHTRKLAKKAKMIMDYYLHGLSPVDAPEAEQDEALKVLRDMIRHFWPDENALEDVIRRKEDVTRPMLILLFLANRYSMHDLPAFKRFLRDNQLFKAEDEDDSVDVDRLVYDALYAELSLMLAECGFAPMDACHPFDWMILYCLAADRDLHKEDGLSADEQIQRFLHRLSLADAPQME